MRKLNRLCAFLFLSFVPGFASQDGLIVGASGGYSILTKIYPDRSDSVKAPDMMILGARLGYSHYFVNYFGGRVYSDALYNFTYFAGRQSDRRGSDELCPSDSDDQTQVTTVTNNYAQVGINADFVYDLFKGMGSAFGAYLGMGVAWGMYKGSTGIIFPVNLGFSVLFRENQRFDIGFKVPLNGVRVGQAVNRHSIVSLGYSYLFKL